MESSHGLPDVGVTISKKAVAEVATVELFSFLGRRKY